MNGDIVDKFDLEDVLCAGVASGLDGAAQPALVLGRGDCEPAQARDGDPPPVLAGAARPAQSDAYGAIVLFRPHERETVAGIHP